jgi:hypothetical protein
MAFEGGGFRGRRGANSKSGAGAPHSKTMVVVAGVCFASLGPVGEEGVDGGVDPVVIEGVVAVF